MAGENEIAFPTVPVPEVQVYVLAPLPFRIVLSPKQTTGLLAVPLTTGNGFTVMVTTATLVLVQPAVLVPASV